MRGSSCKLIVIIGLCYLIALTNSDLSGDIKQLIREIKPGFEENLVRAFKNEAIRAQQFVNNNWYLHKLEDILFSWDDTKIELDNLTFPWIPDFRIINLTVDLGMLCLDVAFKLGDLRIEGHYDATNMILQKLLPITNTGKIEAIFREVTARGRVGLLIKGDSLVAENYDIKYNHSETAINVTYYIGNESPVENTLVKPKGDDIIGETIWVQLYSILTNLLHRQLGESVAQFSLTELLEDQDAELREMAREHSAKANRLLDSLLCSAKDYLVARNFRSIETPSFNVVYRGKPSDVFQGRLYTGVGYIQDLSTLSRLQDVSLYEDQQKLYVYGSLSLREMKHGYEHFRSQYEDTSVNGSIRASVYENKIFIKLVVGKEGERCKTQLDTVQVSSVKDIDVDASGLASLSWLVPQLRSWVIGNLRYAALPVLERYIKEAFDNAIAKTDCVALLFD